jgi:dihydropteroate synthase
MIDWQTRPYWVMGVVNVTPDSFSDGGRFLRRDAALRHAERLLSQGAHILDLGAESTRPNAPPVSEQEELDRLMPVLTALSEITDVPLSVDTSKPAVMQAALQVGVKLLNDVRAFQLLGCESLLSAYPRTSVCVVHMQGEPQTMQQAPSYDDVVSEVVDFWRSRIECLQLTPERTLLDPGFGFGKTLAHNISLFKSIPRLVELGYPLLIGVSRKSMLGQICAIDDPAQRDAASVAAAVLAIKLGAKVVRVHDVASTVQALTINEVLGS